MTEAHRLLNVISSFAPLAFWAKGDGFGLGVWLALIGAGLVGLIVELARLSSRGRAAARTAEARRAGAGRRVEPFPDGVASMDLNPKQPNLRGGRYRAIRRPVPS